MDSVFALVRLVLSSYSSTCALNICIEERIFVRERVFDADVRAVIIPAFGSKIILVNHNLSRMEKCRAIYHELYHHFRHTSSRARTPFHSCELSADIFASCMLLEQENYRRCCEKRGISVETEFMRLMVDRFLRQSPTIKNTQFRVTLSNRPRSDE